jgi:hypothetical protein
VDWFAIVFVLVIVGAFLGLYFTRGKDGPLDSEGRRADLWWRGRIGKRPPPPDEV